MQGHMVRGPGPGQGGGSHHIGLGGPRLQGPGAGPGQGMGPMGVASYTFNSQGVLAPQQRGVPGNVVQLQPQRFSVQGTIGNNFSFTECNSIYVLKQILTNCS